jgi:A/G-specific adenine glycosylase
MGKREEPHAAVALLDWYEQNKRDLPWRKRSDPYGIWVSEIMLQQTQVETVLPYYERFLTRFPTLDALATATIEEVLGCWSGLGYYRRARHLHQAAREIVEANRGFPRDLEGLKALPGIGSYTAAAVGSIAFGIVEPAIDGNILRVVGRFLGIDGNPKRGEARRRIEKTTRELLIADRAGDSNQALMELGATLCRPRKPLCSGCPLASGCEALRAGRPEEFAVPASRGNQIRVRRQLVVVRKRQRILLFRRGEESERLAGMWELPFAEPGDGVSAESSLAERYGGQWWIGDSLGRVRHAITNRLFDVEILEGEQWVDNQLAERAEAQWFDCEEIHSLAVSSLVKKALAKLSP